MEDTIEICSGCGKMPRTIDRADGIFVCSRCGNRATVYVSGQDYEKTVTDLDRRFHEKIIKTRFDAAASEPVHAARPKAAPKKAKAPARKPAKKPAKKAPAKKKKR